jgi:peptidoglycan hydrolase CwlO-like protein
MEDVKRRKVFRNASANREYGLRERVKGEGTFIFRPGQTVEALDEAEEKQLGAYFEIKDVALETPALANTISDLQKQLDDERAKNKTLKAEKETLEVEVEKTNRRLDAKPVRR